MATVFKNAADELPFIHPEVGGKGRRRSGLVQHAPPVLELLSAQPTQALYFLFQFAAHGATAR